MNELSDFPTGGRVLFEGRDVREMSKSELDALWKELLGECSSREGAIACRAFDIGWCMCRKAVE